MPCGTPAAYERHRVRGEEIDEACRRANAERVKPYNRARNKRDRWRREARTRALEALAARHGAEFQRLLMRELATGAP